MTWFRCSSASGTSLPDDIACGEITLASAGGITLPYDITKTPITISVWLQDHNTFSSASKGFGLEGMLTTEDTWAKNTHYTSGNGSQTGSSSYGSITVDSATGTIAVANRYDFAAGTYSYFIQYATT